MTHHQLDPATPLFDAFAFGDNPQLADELAALVLQGSKVATASLLWEYEDEGSRPPQPGDLSIVTNADGLPLCVIQTTGVEVRPFEQVSEEFAAAEGEGDLSLASWRDGHWKYFGRVCLRIGRELSLRMPVVCERFRVIYQAG
ncbi:MAG: ASCH domain-containing protein [Chloroflexota bacterium]